MNLVKKHALYEVLADCKVVNYNSKTYLILN